MSCELEKCLNGQWYNCHDPLFLEFKRHAAELSLRYNALPYECKSERLNVLSELIGSFGENVSVGTPFHCDYGRNIHLGSNVSINVNCTFADCNTIHIGSNVLIGPNVQLYTPEHPLNLDERLTPGWDGDRDVYFCQTRARPIHIGDGCWLGGGVIVLPGVTIGDGTVVGAGSVVTKDLPPNVLACGNPCRVIRPLNGRRSC